MKPKMSVLLPVFNNEKTIAQAIRSILHQTFSDFELIIINDGSSDGTIDILKTFDDSRIKIIGGSENIGLPRRLNQGISEAQGIYIARMDADDVAFADRFQKQVDYLDVHPEIDVLATRAIIFNNEHQLLGLLPFTRYHAEIISRPWNAIPMPHPTWMVRRSWYQKYQYTIPEIWRAEDQDILLRAHHDSVYECLPDVLLCYRRTDPNFSNIRSARWYWLKAQLGYFLNHRQITYILLSILVFGFKSIYDISRKFSLCHYRSGYNLQRELIQTDVYQKAKQVLENT